MNPLKSLKRGELRHLKVFVKVDDKTDPESVVDQLIDSETPLLKNRNRGPRVILRSRQ